MNHFRFLAFIVATFLLHSPCARTKERPVTGREVPRYAAFDQVMSDFMDAIGAEAASLAISSQDHIVYSRGYGWCDLEKSRPTQPTNTFRLASNTKPITAAIVKNLIRGNRLTPSTLAFEYLEIKPYNGQWGDNRLPQITIANLLEHRSGWDRSQTYDPTYRLSSIKKEMNLQHEVTATNAVEYMLAQQLEFNPGDKRVYSNFGYLVLGRVIEKATGEKYENVVQAMICRPLGITDIRLSATNPAERDPMEVSYPKESGLDIVLRDSLGGLTSSAPSLCMVLDRYWINGDRRKPQDHRSYSHRGSQPNSTTALMEQRADGINYVALFNARRNDHHEQDTAKLRSAINDTIDEIKTRED